MSETTKEKSLKWLEDDSSNAPYWNHIGMEFEQLEPGNVKIKLPLKNELMNANGVMHGGVLTSLLDTVSGITIRSMNKVRVATISLSTQFIAPVRGGTIYASAQIINPGKRIQYVESKVMDENGNIVGTALATFTTYKMEQETK